MIVLSYVRPAMILAFVLFVAFAAAACKNGEKTAGEGQPPDDLEIVFGMEGAFAGRGMGYTIRRDGEVERWEGKFPGENREAAATISADEVSRLWKRAEEIGFLQMSDQVMATTNSFITVTAGGESTRVTWVERDEDALTAAQQFFDECMAVAKAALGEEE